jgi:RecA/RadA recombinase
MSKKLLKIPDSQAELMSKLNRCAPDDNSGVLWEVCRTSEKILSSVNYVLSTGLQAFDDLVGGMPFGRIVEVFGLEGCGKSALALRCAGRARLKHIRKLIRNDDDTVAYEAIDPDTTDVNVFYIDNEQSLDLDGKITFEGQVLDILDFRCDTTDMMFKGISNVLDAAEARMDKYPERLLFTLIVVDTITSTTSKQEMEQAWGTQDYPRQPQQISRALARLTRRINQCNACVIFTNQVRTKFKPKGPMGRSSAPAFGVSSSDYSPGGGLALRFYATHRVFMYAMESKYKLIPTAKFAAGLQIGFHTVKNRIPQCKPLRDGRMVLLFDKEKGGLNDCFSTLETLVFLKFIECKQKEKSMDYVLKFSKSGITPTTFDATETTTTLDQDDDNPNPLPRRGGSRKDPSFRYRSDWPKFLEDHRADVDKLWAAAMKYAMQTEGLDGGVVVEEDDNEPRAEEGDD